SSCLSTLSLEPAPPPSFPTRRSSDLVGDGKTAVEQQRAGADQPHAGDEFLHRDVHHLGEEIGGVIGMQAHHPGNVLGTQRIGDRSEEHTSELQSRENLVCRLLLEKKK